MIAVNGPRKTFRLLWDFAWLRSRRNWQTARNDDKQVFGFLFMGLMVSVTMVFLYRLAFGMMEVVVFELDPAGLLPSAPEGVLGFFLALGGGVALFMGLSRANDVLYLRSDISWAMALPLDRRGVVLARVAETAVGVVGLVAVVSVPSLVAYVVLFSAWYVLALLPVVVVALALLGSAVGVLAVIMAGRLAASSRWREVAGLLGSIAGAMLYFLLWTRLPTAGGMVDTLARSLVEVVGSPRTAIPALALLPVAWPALAIRFISWGPVSTGVLILAAGVSGTAATVWGLSVAGARAYARGLGQGATARPRRRAVAISRPRAESSRERLGGGVLGALVRRDWAILTRSPRLWQAMAMPIAWIVYWMVMRDPFLSGDYLLMGGLGALASSVTAGTLAQMSFGIEGVSFYHLATLPVSPLSRVISKVLVFTLPAAVVGLALVLVMYRGGGSAADLLRAAALVITASITMVAATVMLTVGDTNFEATNPGQMHNASTGCLPMFLLGIVMIVAYLILLASRDIGRRVGVAPGVASTIGVVLVAAFCLGLIVPASLRNAAEAVKSRGRGVSLPSILTW